MKTIALVFLLLNAFPIMYAQNGTPQQRRNLEEASRALDRFNRKPRWQQNYELNIAAGTIFVRQGEYAKALRNFNTALSIVPNSQEAIYGRNLCRQILKNRSRIRK